MFMESHSSDDSTAALPYSVRPCSSGDREAILALIHPYVRQRADAPSMNRHPHNISCRNPLSIKFLQHDGPIVNTCGHKLTFVQPIKIKRMMNKKAVSLSLDANWVLERREPIATQRHQVQTRRRLASRSWADTA